MSTGVPIHFSMARDNNDGSNDVLAFTVKSFRTHNVPKLEFYNGTFDINFPKVCRATRNETVQHAAHGPVDDTDILAYFSQFFEGSVETGFKPSENTQVGNGCIISQ